MPRSQRHIRRRRTCFSFPSSLVSVTVVPIYARFSLFNFSMGLRHVLHAELCAVWKRISIKHPQISLQIAVSDQNLTINLFT